MDETSERPAGASILMALLVLILTVALCVPVVLFPPCSFQKNVNNSIGPANGHLPVWVALHAHHVQREQFNNRNTFFPPQPETYESVTIHWSFVVVRVVMILGCGLAVLIYWQAIRLPNQAVVLRYSVWRMVIAGSVLGGIVVPCISLLDKWSRAVPTHNPFLSGSNPWTEFGLATILSLIAAGIGAVAGLAVGTAVGTLARKRLTKVQVDLCSVNTLAD